MLQTIIIGKSSNLSKTLSIKLSNYAVISSREIINNIDVLKEFKNKKINIIFNNFQPATELNTLHNAQKYVTNSILVTAKVLDYFKDTRINKIIYTSSSSVYGNNILCNEQDELKPLNLHASLKVANEKLVEKFSGDNNIDYTIARIFNMYGGDDNFSIISKIIKAYKTNQELTIVNNGNAIRDFIHIDDVVEIYIKLLGLKNIPILNVGTGNGVSIKTIIDYLKNNQIEVLFKNINKNELKASTADNQLLINLIGEKTFKEVQQFLKEELKI
ncbi:MAG: NAD-dependent epimerase [Sulfurimonas sp. RIFCSPHIGHO2_12_FULL_36_9]|nr:MAG: NAD-dependent epimerase [Sulfurimonas sp. RIFCSPHIGHO2_12_FULL_36_9]OHE00560.1 MAG: NAD-dependent epimerase [Sulfurimonas sp. RIFCSPLOWO2_12_36_12]